MRIPPPLRQSVLLAAKPLVLGNGPFIDIPKFVPIGHPSHLLNITIPSAGRLNIRHGYVVAVDGNLDGAMTTATNIQGLEYHVIQPFSPLLVLVAGNAANYALLENTPSEKWTVVNLHNIIAWSGYNLDLRPVHILEKCHSYQTSGEGTVVINSDQGALFNLDVGEGEELIVNPSSVVATTTEIRFVGLQRPPRDHKLITQWLPAVPRTGIIGTLGTKWDQFKQQVVTHDVAQKWQEVRSHIKNINQWVRINLVNKIWRQPVYARIRGPAQVLVNNVSLSPSKNFTSRELDQAWR